MLEGVEEEGRNGIWVLVGERKKGGRDMVDGRGEEEGNDGIWVLEEERKK